MKRNRILLVLISLMVLTLSSCVKDENTQDGVKSLAVQFTSTIVSSAPQTKTTPIDGSTTGTSWVENDKIGVYMIPSRTTLGTPDAPLADNVAYTATPLTTDINRASFRVANESSVVYFPVDGSDVQFIAYYPYSDQIKDYAYPVDVSKQTDLAAMDLLYSNISPDYNMQKSDVFLPFFHAMCMLKFHIEAGAGITTDDLKGMMVTIQGMPTTADFSLVPPSSFENRQGSNTDISVLTQADGQAAQAMVIPQDRFDYTFTDRKVLFELNGGNVYTLNLADDFALDPGTLYDVYLLITKTRVAVDKIEISDWTTNEIPIHCYAVGDIYPFDTSATKPVAGVVFSVTNGGANGKIVSLNDAKLAWDPSSSPSHVSSQSMSDGKGNTAKIKLMSDFSEEEYPAAYWCVNHKEGSLDWYMPAANDLVDLRNAKDKINPALKKISATELLLDGVNYASSTETTYADIVSMDFSFGNQIFYSPKSYAIHCRAIAAF